MPTTTLAPPPAPARVVDMPRATTTRIYVNFRSAEYGVAALTARVDRLAADMDDLTARTETLLAAVRAATDRAAIHRIWAASQ